MFKLRQEVRNNAHVSSQIVPELLRNSCSLILHSHLPNDVTYVCAK